MSGFSSKTRFNDGEGLVSGDFEDVVNYQQRQLIDEIMTMIGAPDDATLDLNSNFSFPAGIDAVTSFRTYRRALCPRIRSTGFVVDFDDGLCMQQNLLTFLTQASTEPQNAVAYTRPLTVTVGAAHATLYRRDIFQARIVQTDEANVARDFKDAVTGALSSQNVLKRTNGVVQVTVKAGATYASSALADTPANEQTPDAGYFKIGSIRVDPTATNLDMRTMWDWRKPFGFSGALVNPQHFTSEQDSSELWELATDGGYYQLSQASGSIIRCHPLHACSPTAPSFSGTISVMEEHRRVRHLAIYGTFTDSAPGTMLLGPYSFLSETDGPAADIRDVTSFASSGAPASQGLAVYESPDLGYQSPLTAVKPLWANGFTSPARGSNVATDIYPLDHYMLEWRYNSYDNTDRVRGLVATWWGM